MSLGLGLGIGLFKGVGSLAAVGKRVIGESVVLNDLPPTFTRANPVATDPVTGSVVGSNVRRRLPIALPGKSVLADLIEGSRANICLQSQTFASPWAGSLFSLAAAPGLAPDGTATATRLTFSNTNSYFGVSASCAAGTPNTRSIYYKRVGNDWAYVLAYYDASNRATLWVNLATGQKGQQTTQGTATISATDVVAVGGGWYRVSITSQHPSLGTPTFNVGHCSGDGISTATAGNSVDIWGAQVELGAFPSSYIPTTTVAVTRSADSLSVALSSLVDTRTNLLPYSQDFSNAVWVKSATGSGTVPSVSGTYTAPDGTSTAQRIDFASTGTDQSIVTSATATTVAASVYTASMYLKAATVGDIGKSILVRHAGGSTYTPVTLTDSWVRLTLSETAVGVSSTLQFGLRPNLGGSSGSVSALVWGAQLSQTAAAIEYLPTVASAITTGPTGLSLDHGTMLSVWVPYGHQANTGDYAYMWGNNTSDNVGAAFFYSSGNMKVCRGTAAAGNGTTKAAPTGLSLASRVASTIAQTWASGDNRLAVNGVQQNSAAGATFPADALTTAYIGSNNGAGNYAFGYVALLYWPRALTAGEIAALQTVIGQGVTLAL